MPKSFKRFLKYSSIGISTFAFDLLLLYFFTDYLQWNYVIATGVAFAMAISINYYFSRLLVFRGTLKSIHAGYLGFMTIACIGIVVAMVGMSVLVGIVH